MTGTALALTQGVPATEAHTSLSDRLTYAREFAQAGLFHDSRTASQCLVRIQAGAELGIPPFASMNGISIIEGKPSIGGGLFAALIDASPDHELEVLEHTEAAAHGRMWGRSKRTREWIVKGEFRFTWQDAIQAGLSGKPVWQKNRRQMLYWRMVSNLARMYAAALCAGMYTAEELGAPIDEDGNYLPPPPAPIAVRSIEDTPPQPGVRDPGSGTGTLRATLQALYLEAARDRKFKATPQSVAKALGLEVPEVVSRLYKGKARLLLDECRDAEIYQLTRFVVTGAPVPLPEAERDVEQMQERLGAPEEIVETESTEACTNDPTQYRPEPADRS